ncbi:MAG TPA: DUF6544 family protein [Caulobacteraceae bacterium]|nr:DUF6544 family protein [Caulobacteraceae bacterium]
MDEAGAQLPAPVRDLAIRLGANPRLRRDAVRLSQSGRMRPGAGAGWSDFTADETISTTGCAFDWRARTGVMGAIRIRDSLSLGEARLEARVFGFLPAARLGVSAAVTRGELIRYLAELAWAPDAILHNPALRWRALEGKRGFELGAGEGDAAASVEVSLDADGRIGAVFAADRPRATAAGETPTPWRGRFSNYRLSHGLWTPLDGASAWEIGGEDVTCWEAHVTAWTIWPD